MWKGSVFVALIIHSVVAPLTDDDTSLIKDCDPDCDSEVYCYGELLKTIMLADLHKHPKYFVDKKLLDTEENILKKFQKLKEDKKLKDKHALQEFVDENFEVDPPEPCEITDLKLRPPLINKIKDFNYQEYFESLQKLWPALSVRSSNDVKTNPRKHSFVYLPECYIKAGGFFTAQFYWDSYWIIRGLALTEMFVTAKKMLINFFHLIDSFGHVLNANRKYYSLRSQPPFLPLMMQHYITANPQDIEFLKENLLKLEREFKWWLDNRSVTFTKDNKEYTLYQYHQKSCYPRPEGFTKDYKKGQEFKTDKEKYYFYTQTHSVAESGLDFSTRQRRIGFYEPGYGTRKNLDITGTVPVELNSLLAMNARLLSEWFEKFNDSDKAKDYKDISEKLIRWIDEVFRDEEKGAWFDWDLVENKHRTKFYATNLSPLYTQSYNKEKAFEIGKKAVQYLITEHIIHEDRTPKFYGVPTSMILSPEQWDYKNCWAPLQSFIIEGLYNTGNNEAIEVAIELAKIWVKTNYEGFKKTNHMFEKYDAVELGQIGGGGTYDPQIGFGWSNGFVTVLFHLFGEKLQSTDYDGFVADTTGVDTTTVVHQ